jgi:hypothetical protein
MLTPPLVSRLVGWVMHKIKMIGNSRKPILVTLDPGASLGDQTKFAIANDGQCIGNAMPHL